MYTYQMRHSGQKVEKSTLTKSVSNSLLGPLQLPLYVGKALELILRHEIHLKQNFHKGNLS